MKEFESDVLIIGAGLSGLALNYFLRNADLKVRVVEARERVGGRILTEEIESFAPVEMGATWFGSQHAKLMDLIAELGLAHFPQKLGKKAIYEPISTSPHQIVSLPENEEPSFRVRGGTSRIIESLKHYLSADKLFTETAIENIRVEEDELVLNSSQKLFRTKLAISTLPPYLFHESIDTQPSIPEATRNVMQSTHTWMGDAIKVALQFSAPFWKENGKFGTIFSNVGPITEFYDHCNYEENRFALMGFINPAYHSVKPEERKALVLKQLKNYFGTDLDLHTDYTEKVWIQEKFTFSPYKNYVLPHQNNGHEFYKHSYLEERLLFAGAETANAFPGYMEGAIRSALWAFEWIRSKQSEETSQQTL